jgi:hypothetical protein
MKYTEINELWYKVGGDLKSLNDDAGTDEMLDWAKKVGKVNLYLVNTVSQHVLVPLIEDVEVVTQNSEANFNEFQSDEDGFGSEDMFEDSADEYIMDDEVVINNVVNVEPEKKKKNKGGRPKKQTLPVTNQITQIREVEPESDEDFSFNIGEKRKRALRLRESDEEYNSSDLQTDLSGDSDEEPKEHYPPFVMPKKMVGYKWTLGTRFSSKKEFKEAISNYSVCNAKDLKFLKNDKTRVRVGCKDGCPWVALCSKIPEEDTWQLRKLDDNHTCGHEFSIRFLNSEWLGKKLMPNVRENSKIKLTTISNKAHEEWNVKVSRMKAYRARKKAIDMVDGSFREQYRRLHDYGHEILRSNPHSSVKIQVQPTEQHEVPTEEAYISRPLLPSFQRMYMCIDGCKQSFFKCRPFIGLDGCFLKGYYGGMILAAVGRDPNDQMLPIALAVVEGETKDSWTWFLKWLIKDLGGTDECKKITFMSDQQKVIS